MELFWAVKMGELENHSTRQCRVCGKALELVQIVFDLDGEVAIRVFECECGERTWDE
jgi:C4-type Zn-finger protein